MTTNEFLKRTQDAHFLHVYTYIDCGSKDYQIFGCAGMVDEDAHGNKYLIISYTNENSTFVCDKWIYQMHEKCGNMPIIYDWDDGTYSNVDKLLYFGDNCVMLKISNESDYIDWC